MFGKRTKGRSLRTSEPWIVVDIDQVAGKVHVNGTDVGMVAEDGVKIEVGNTGDVLTVTLVLLPHEVRLSSLLSA